MEAAFMMKRGVRGVSICKSGGEHRWKVFGRMWTRERFVNQMYPHKRRKKANAAPDK